MNSFDYINYWKNVYAVWNSRNAQQFVLYDGPPYANGDIHIGHALNKILKDTINRFKALQGYKVNYILGWDCHGLPIEAKVEADFKAKGRIKSSVPRIEMVNACRDFAEQWIQKQKQSFAELGVIADNTFYRTMDHENEVQVVEFVHKLAKNNLLMRKMRPTLWSCEEGTALADAEIEYQDKVSTSVDVLMKIASTNIPELQNAYVCIWTTTPWSLPSNKAIAYHDEFSYCILNDGDRCILVGENLVAKFLARFGRDLPVQSKVTGSQLNETKYYNPFSNVVQPMLHSDHVTTEQGTGFVHIAPDHGLEDFGLSVKHGIECCCYINDSGYFANLPEHLDFLNGQFYANSIDSIIEKLSDMIVSTEKITHSYPHSWRSRKPVIYRATKQWFINIDPLKDKVLSLADEIRWHPKHGKNRFTATVASRESWCISRQRVWGVPMCILHKDGKILTDRLDDALAFVKEHGVHAWEKFDAGECEKVSDILDVWLQSGLVPRYIARITGIESADVMIEGSDQHRGWFPSCLYVSAIETGESCVREISTHGYVVDDEGKKMSKSKSNGLAPKEIIDAFGLEALRLWALTKDYTQELKIAKSHFVLLTQIIKKIQLTVKFLMRHAKKHEDIHYADYSILEKWVLSHMHKIHTEMMDYHKTIEATGALFSEIRDFCEHVLSKIYFDIIKERLYFDSDKQAIESCLWHVLNYLLLWIAPFMPITAEENWQIFSGNHWNGESVHAQIFPDMPADWQNERTEMEAILQLRDEVNSVIEKIRADSETIKNNGDCIVTISAPSSYDKTTLEQVLLVPKVILHSADELRIDVAKYGEEKCDKCRKRKPNIQCGWCERCIKVFPEIYESYKAEKANTAE